MLEPYFTGKTDSFKTFQFRRPEKDLPQKTMKTVHKVLLSITSQ